MDAVSLDDPGKCSEPPRVEAFFDDLVNGFGECIGESVRGETWLGTWQRIAR